MQRVLLEKSGEGSGVSFAAVCREFIKTLFEADFAFTCDLIVYYFYLKVYKYFSICKITLCTVVSISNGIMSVIGLCRNLFFT